MKFAESVPVVAVVAFALTPLGCGNAKPAHSYVFEGYRTTYDGSTAYVFESDETEGDTGHVEYSVICIGHLKGDTTDDDCRAIKRYLNRMLPPTYRTSPDGEHSFLDIPSMNLEFQIVEAN